MAQFKQKNKKKGIDPERAKPSARAPAQKNHNVSPQEPCPAPSSEPPKIRVRYQILVILEKTDICPELFLSRFLYGSIILFQFPMSALTRF